MVARSLPCHAAGGLEYHVADLAAGLASRGLSVELLTAPLPANYREELRERGLKCHEVAGIAPERYSLRYLRRVGPAIEALRRSGSFDLIHGQEFALGFWRPAADVAARTVLSVHGTLWSETPLQRDVFGSLPLGGKVRAIGRFGRRLLFGPSWRWWLDRAGSILVDSEFTARELRAIRPGYTERIRTIALGVDMERYPFIEASTARRELGWTLDSGAEPVLITVGRLQWQKGHDLALRALAKLRDLSWRYVIVGEGRTADGLKQLAGRLGLVERVEFTGRVDERRKSLLLAAADLFLWPERTQPAFGLVGLEAMLMNTPVAASRRGAIPETIDGQSGWLFQPGDAEAISRALRPLLADPSSIAERSHGLRERTLERFAPGAMISQTLAAYDELSSNAKKAESR